MYVGDHDRTDDAAALRAGLALPRQGRRYTVRQPADAAAAMHPSVSS